MSTWFPSFRGRKHGVSLERAAVEGALQSKSAQRLTPAARPPMQSSSFSLSDRRRGWAPLGGIDNAAGRLADRIWLAGFNFEAAREFSADTAVSEGYERLIYLFLPVNLLAGNQGSRPYQVRRGKEVLKPGEDPLERLLNGQANPLESGEVFRTRLGQQTLISKAGAFSRMKKARSGTPLEVSLLSPSRTRAIPTRTEYEEEWGPIAYYETVNREGKWEMVEPDQVRWHRYPHPLDPYSGTCPLEPAGLSAQLDYYARLFNVASLNNDRRPNTIIVIEGDASDEQVDYLDSVFPDGGPRNAGQTTIIAGQGIHMIDPMPKLPDGAYGSLGKQARTELLSAYRVPESMVGNSSERTFNNGGQEEINFWLGPQTDQNKVVCVGFDQDLPAGCKGGIDLSDVPVLQELQAKKDKQALEEFKAGGLSLVEYKEKTGAGDRVDDTPITRAYMLPQGIVPARAEDARALGFSLAAVGLAPTAAEIPPWPPVQDGSTPRPAIELQQAPAQQPPQHGGQAQRASQGEGGAGPSTGAVKPHGDNTVPTRPAHPKPPAPSPPVQGKAADGGRCEEKAVTPPPPRARRTAWPVLRLVATRMQAKDAAPKPPEGQWDDVRDLPQEQIDRAVQRLALILEADAVRHARRIAARIAGQKARKGTRHWQPDPALPYDTRVGDKPLDVKAAVDADRAADDGEQAADPVLTALAVAAAAYAASQLLGDNQDDATASAVRLGARAAVQPVIKMVAAAVRARADRLAKRLADLDADGASMDAITAAVTPDSGEVSQWAMGIAEQAALTAVDTGRHAAAAAPGVDPEDVEWQWATRRDPRVRSTHAAARGQRRSQGDPFEVGDTQLMYPRDPACTDVSEVAGCRCWLRLRHRVTGRFLAHAG